MLKFFSSLFFIVVVLQCHNSQAQNFSRKRVQKIPVENNFILDSLNIVSETVKIFDSKNNLVDTSYYKVDGIKATITWNKLLEDDSVMIEYINFPFNLSKSFVRKQIITVAAEEDFIVNPYSYMPGKESTTGIIDFGSIDYNGSFTRGLSFGNNQDVVLNSSLNLQLSGNVTNVIEITAALTDNNIPIQPEGNTQQIQEFDKVFIQVGNKNHKVILGDYDAQSFNRYFMRFYKRLQGISYRGTFALKDSVINDSYTFSTNTNLAIARGKFTRNQLNVSEGNQGPYRLRGADNELLIIVMAGTERVYVNGQLKTRGADSDYVIDYNAGEIIFMPSIIITRDTRIFVEFEYAVQNYFRTILYTANDFKINDKLKFNLNFYSEQDNKNQPLNGELTPEQKNVLRNAGDEIQDALFPGFSEEDFDISKVLYKIVDSVANGFSFDTVFVYSTNADSAKFKVLFSEVGAGNGNYIRAPSVANGVVYSWVAPDITGRRLGNYEPVRILITPKREQILTGGMEYADEKNKLFIDVGLSNDDVNTFSEQGDRNNIGVATRANYERRFYLNQSEKKDFYLLGTGYYEFVNHNFSPLERFRPVEFNRDWNLPLTNNTIDEHWGGAAVGIVKTNLWKANYNFNTFQKGSFYKGIMHVLTGDANIKGYYADVNIRYTNAVDTLRNSKYFWPRIEVAKSFEKLKNWKVGSRFEKEDNKLNLISGSDSLINGSFLFNDWRVYIASSDSAINKGRIEYIRRQEFFSRNGEMNLATTSNTYNFSGEWLSKEWQQLRWRLTYRQFENGDSLFTQNENEQYYLGRVEYGLNILKGFFNLNNLYELGSGREQKRLFSYLEVPAGQGNYIWNDYNSNGVQELNEFEQAPAGFTDQARFIKVATPTNDFSPVDINTFNTSLNINPRAKWYGKEGIRGFVSRFSTLTSLQLNRKVFRGSGASIFNPFVTDIEDNLLVATTSLIRQSIFFNRSSSIWGIEYSWQDNQNKNSLINGFEVRSLIEHLFRTRWNILKFLSLNSKYSFGSKGNLSELFTERNYDIRYYIIEPDVTYLLNNKFRATLVYKYTNSKNVLGEIKEKANTHDISSELRYNVVSKSTINSKVTFAIVEYTGGINDAIQFAMLQGLQNGNNYLWNLSFDRNLANNIQLSLVYEGRKTGENKSVHTGRAQVRAIF